MLEAARLAHALQALLLGALVAASCLRMAMKGRLLPCRCWLCILSSAAGWPLATWTILQGCDNEKGVWDAEEGGFVWPLQEQ